MSNAELKQPVLVVDDEADIRDLMEMTLVRMGLVVQVASGVAEAKRFLNKNHYSLVLADMRMTDGSGLDVVNHIMEKQLDTPVAIITAYGNADQAVMALKNGAFDYLQKPITLSQLRSLVKSAIKIHESSEQSALEKPIGGAEFAAKMGRHVASARGAAGVGGANVSGQSAGSVGAGSVENFAKSEGLTSAETLLNMTPNAKNVKMFAAPQRLWGSSALICEVRQLVDKLSKSMVPVYISGESGSGKEQAARSIHEKSPRHAQPFIAVNCGAIPENLMESEFFGYKKGSFTGADTDRDGFFQHANGGTLFLDEVADLPLAMQVKLLRAIQEKAVRRIGDAQEHPVDVRIICATHKDLAAQVAQGKFRQDLFYRLNVVSLAMPPLREMREDLPDLMNQLLKKHRGSTPFLLSQSAERALLNYNYPGNFRELENILERAVALAQNNIIEVDDLQLSAHNIAQARQNDAFDAGMDEDWCKIAASEADIPPFTIGATGLQEYMDDVERHIIVQTLEQTRYNRTKAAKVLGISFRSLRYRMERLQVE